MPTDENMLVEAKKCVFEANKQMPRINYYGFVKLMNLKSQMVAGKKFIYQILVEETVCDKITSTEQKFLDNQCDFKEDGENLAITVSFRVCPQHQLQIYKLEKVKHFNGTL
uniref:Cystatin domain-containing protein n=1 Tax=Rhabditophanes sp. KR3021 TaxID=114890 RepID=A0AC35UA42_9BILA